MTRLRRTRRLIPVLLLALAAPGAAQELSEERPVVNVGIVLDGPPVPGGSFLDSAIPPFVRQMQEEILLLTRSEFDVRFPEAKQVVGDRTPGGIRLAYRRLMNDPEVDLVLVPTVLATSVVAREEPFDKPVVALFGIDIRAQGLPFEGGRSGVRNFTYVLREGTVERDIRTFKDLVGFSRLHILTEPLIREAVPGLDEAMDRSVADLDLELVRIPVVDSADEALAAVQDAEAVYVTPLLRMPTAEQARLIAGLRDLRLPSFSLYGRSEVEQGLLAGVAPKANLSQVARFVALKVQRILDGEDAGELPVLLPQSAKLVINMETARAIGWYPRWTVMSSADLLHEEIEVETRMSLDEAVRLALASNLDLRAEESLVRAGAEEITLARSSLLPQLDVSLSGTRIDADRAEAGQGAQPERAARGSLALSQLLYSDAALAGIDIQKRLQEAREHAREGLRLDVARDAAVGFLDLLRAQTLVGIRRDNLTLTETNLDIARRRRDLGVSGPSEVYRWESQQATDRLRLIESQAGVDAARVVVNRLLNRPLEQAFEAVATDLESPYLVTASGRLDPYVDNPWGFEVFRGFMVAEGLRNAPELMAVDAAIAAQERELLAVRRSFRAPTLSLRAELGRELDTGGAGQVSPFADISLPFFPEFPQADDTDWSVALVASLPLSTGGARLAEARRARHTLDRLRTERDALAERIELSVRLALFAAGASHPGIELSAEAADAARRNYDLVQDTYSKGLVSIIELLDAQNAALVAEQNSANAVFDFLIDLMDGYRATGDFTAFTGPEARDAWFARLEAFYDSVGGPGGPRRR